MRAAKAKHSPVYHLKPGLQSSDTSRIHCIYTVLNSKNEVGGVYEKSKEPRSIIHSLSHVVVSAEAAAAMPVRERWIEIEKEREWERDREKDLTLMVIW